jgi:cytochrome c oxidase subunit IV
MNLRTKLRNLSVYRRTLQQYKNELGKTFGLRIDKLGRCFTVLTFPEEAETNIRVYGHQYVDNEVRNYLRGLMDYFRKIGLFEYTEIEKLDQLNEKQVLIIISFKYMNLEKWQWTKRSVWGILFPPLGLFYLWVWFRKK